MIPDPAEILRRRVTAVTTIRIISIFPALVAFSIAGGWIAQSITDRMYTEEHVAFGVMVSVIAGASVVMWSLAPYSARQAVKMPKKLSCPACRYRLEGLTEKRCPECGLILTSEFLAEPGEKTPPPRDPDRVMMRQLATTIVRLVLAVLMIGLTPFALFGTVETLRWWGGDWYEFAPVLVAYFLLLVCFTLLIGAGKLSGYIVPKRAAFEGASQSVAGMAFDAQAGPDAELLAEPVEAHADRERA